MIASQPVIELIQIALTPVFLIVGIGTMINVVTGRVARVIDRARWYETQIEQHNLNMNDRMKKELRLLDKRLKLANWSINFLTGAAVIVCIDIIMLLVSGLVNTNMDTILLVLFMLSISFITGGLIAFFLEVTLATATLRIPRSLR